jgi:hypothetical protein
VLGADGDDVPAGNATSAASALDAVLGGGEFGKRGAASAGNAGELEQDLLSILLRSKRD